MNVNDLLKHSGMDRVASVAQMSQAHLVTGFPEPAIMKLARSLVPQIPAAFLAESKLAELHRLQTPRTLADTVRGLDAVAHHALNLAPWMRAHEELLSLTRQINIVHDHIQSASATLLDSVIRGASFIGTASPLGKETQTIFDFLPDLARLIPTWAGVREEFLAAAESGYSLAYDILPDGFFESVSDTDPRVRNAVATNKVLSEIRASHFTDELTEIFAESAILKPRAQILAAGGKAHLRREYLLSVPVLLAQAEGVFTDLLVLKGEARKKGNKIAAVENGAVKKDRDGKTVYLSGLVAKIQRSNLRKHVLTEEVAEFLVEKVSSRRNAILHGQDTRYRSAKLSIQLLFTLASLARVIVDAEAGRIDLNDES